MTDANVEKIISAINNQEKPSGSCLQKINDQVGGAFKEINNVKENKLDKDIFFKGMIIIMVLIGIVYSATISIMWYLLAIKDVVK